MIDLNELCTKTLENAKKRQTNGGHIKADTRSLLKHCSTEVVEAMEAFTEWKNYDGLEGSEEELKKHFSSELADIICCVLIISGKENIDIEKAVFDCVEKNRKRAEGIGDKL